MAEKKTIAEMEQKISDSEARNRLISLFDEDSFVELDKFVSSKGETVGVITGYGQVDGTTVYAFAQDMSVKSGAVCKASAAKIKKVYELALKNGSPVAAIYDSNGADVSEGIELLAAYGEIADASAKLSGVVPQVAIVAGVCAGTTAMLACMADYVIMTEKSELFMTAPSVAEDKAENAGTAENAAKSGVAAIVVKDGAEAAATAKKLLAILPQNNLELAGNDYYEENSADVTADLKGGDMAKALADADSVIELYEDFGTSAYVALGSINWRTVGFVAANGKLTSADSAKIARFVSTCDAFSIPVVTIADTEGFVPSAAAELAGSIRDAAKLTQVYASATTAKITLITGKAYAGAYVALASASDFTLAFEDAVIAPCAPTAAAIMLHSDEIDSKEKLAELAAEYEANDASPFNAAAYGYVDRVITADEAKAAITSAMDLLSSKRVAAPARKHINFVY